MDQISGAGHVHFFSAFCKAKNKDFLMAVSLGNTPLFLMIFRICRLMDSMVFVV